MKQLVCLILIVSLFTFLLCGCSSDDGICDNAECTRTATCSFGDMELCTKHYDQWSDRAYESNHRYD